MAYEEQDPRTSERADPNAGYYPYSSYYNRPKKKKRTGLLVCLALLAILTGTASWIVNMMGVDVEVHESGMTVTIGDRLPQQEAAQPEDPVLTQDKQMPEIDPSYPVVDDSTGDSLVVNASPDSVENCPSGDENALSLQEIYSKSIASVASISCVTRTGTAGGTGIVMSRDGYIITNYHVIEDAQLIRVLLEEDDVYEATLIGADETTDLAVLKVEADDLTPAEFGDSDRLRVGDPVVAIGDPLGTELRGTMTDGIVSAINRDLNLNGRRMTLIQTNAALNHGNSGGPLINCYGQVIGINTMKMSNYSSDTSSVEGLGFAIPITAAEPILEELIRQGYVSGRPAIGISGQAISQYAYWFYHMPMGVAVTEIVAGSDAETKGLLVDDIIVRFNDEAIYSLEDLVTAKSDCVSGDMVKLTIYRQGRYYEVWIELMDQVSPDIY